MINLLKLVLSVAIAYHAEAGTVKLNVSLLSHTFEGSLTVGHSSHDGFKSCILDELFSGIQIRDLAETSAFSTKYRQKHFGPCIKIDSIHIDVNHKNTTVATMNCSKFVQAKCEMYCEAVFTTADINKSIKALQNNTGIKNCSFKLRKIVNPISPQVTVQEVLENSENKNSTLLVLGIALGATMLVIFIAVFTCVAGKLKRFTMFTNQAQKSVDFCLAELSDTLNSQTDWEDCPDNIYSTLDGDGDTEGVSGSPLRDLYSLPEHQDCYSVCRYESLGINKDQTKFKVDGDLLRTVGGYQDDYIDVTETSDYVQTTISQAKVKAEGADMPTPGNSSHDDYIDVMEHMLMHTTPRKHRIRM